MSKKLTFYSTDPDTQRRFDEGEEDDVVSLDPKQQKLRIHRETKHRGGKEATIVKGFIGKEEDLEALGKALKNKCGVGGSVKDGEIILQGDQRQKALEFLKSKGYNDTKLAGG